MNTQYAWHVHHDTLLEPLTEPLEARIAYIREHKPLHEQERRLRLLKLVQGPLPAGYEEARQVYREAGQVYREAWRVYDETRRVYDEAERVYDETWQVYREAGQVYREAWRVYREAAQTPELLALHALECPDCPWDGSTIFPAHE